MFSESFSQRYSERVRAGENLIDLSVGIFNVCQTKQNPGRLIGALASATGTVPGCSRERYRRYMTKVNDSLWTFAEEHFTSIRLSKYLGQAKGDQEQAVLLYRWNSELSAAVWEALGYLEVALRNLLDKKLTERHVKLGRSGHWILDDNFEFGRSPHASHKPNQPFFEVTGAIKRVERNRKRVTPDQIISELSFGFWNQLISKKHQFLWPDLASGFPNAPSRDQSYISNLTQDIRRIRNRIGHHHRLNPELAKNAEQIILQLAFSIDSQLVDWIEERSRISQLMLELDLILASVGPK